MLLVTPSSNPALAPQVRLPALAVSFPLQLNSSSGTRASCLDVFRTSCLNRLIPHWRDHILQRYIRDAYVVDKAVEWGRVWRQARARGVQWLTLGVASIGRV